MGHWVVVAAIVAISAGGGRCVRAELTGRTADTGAATNTRIHGSIRACSATRRSLHLIQIGQLFAGFG